MAWIGLDDTDTVNAGCTTYEFHQLIKTLSQMSDAGAPWQHPTDPTLVRLWPFAPQRTRGNAAVACRIEVGGKHEFEGFLSEWFAALSKRLQPAMAEEGTGPEPVLIVADEVLPEFYWRAVRRFVSRVDVEKILKTIKGIRIWNSPNRLSGVVGAFAAMCWTGAHDHTWELTAYREPMMIGKPRSLSTSSVVRMARGVKGTFLNRDPNSGDSLICPRTPCPVLYGIRGESSESVLQAHDLLQSFKKNEHSRSHQCWRTNQATGDHLEQEFSGVVIHPALELKGGHAALEVQSVGGAKDQTRLVAFKEGGPVNDLLRKASKGDLVSWMGLRSQDGAVHLERFKIHRASAAIRRRPNCYCGGVLKSAGASQALRCSACKSLHARIWLNTRSKPSKSWVEPNAKQRRHLAKPLARESSSSDG